MRIAVVSDTHGSWQGAQAALAELMPLDLLLFAGDNYRDPFGWAQHESVPVVAVTGNCDVGAHGPGEEVVDLGSVRSLTNEGK
jgi:predicted phosphodiesterase